MTLPANTEIKVDYHLITPVGATVDTFDTEDLARKRLGERKANLPGAEVWEKTTTVTWRRVYRPRLAVGL